MKELPRKEFIYWNDDGQLVAVRYNEWKAVFLEQNNEGMGVWQGQFTNLRIRQNFSTCAPIPSSGVTKSIHTTNGW